MSKTNLASALRSVGRSQADLSRFLLISTAAVNAICQQNTWPKRLGSRAKLEPRIREFLRKAGAADDVVATALNEAPDTRCANSACPMAVYAAFSGPHGLAKPEDDSMVLRAHTLSPAARAHFRIPRDPFNPATDVTSDADVFLSDDIRYVRSAMRLTVKTGGMIAVIAESGAGKSTLRKDLEEWVRTSGEPVTLIKPFVLGMGTSERLGRPLVAEDIIRAIFRELAPNRAVPRSIDDRSALMSRLLSESVAIGRRHAVLIEEAHDLATPTLKHLKRFYELEDGFRRLLGIMLIGQTELERRLSAHDPLVREVVQRCEIVHLQPLDNNLEAYLRHKLQRVDVKFEDVFEAGAADEIRVQLRGSIQERNGRGGYETRLKSLCHPLAVNNLVSGAMNLAASIGSPKLNAALIAQAAKDA
ncbi:AAA family ATPase [uncultured Pseudacidovorax sp.]|uniref:ExeA family protein n=1 Tax=uncultured Pseudacidovorax sp. TaxID=679313 RepID=UPI0025DD0DF9|nr:AAA family ATPase [uncultured Pseudacidovorax sp.]